VNELEEAIRRLAPGGRLPCAALFRLAAQSDRSPRAVRERADRIGVRISRCQLGLFGTEEFGEPRYARAHPLSTIPEGLADTLRGRCRAGRLPCRTAWEIADEEDVPRLLIGCAAEGLSLPVGPCQLGCF